MKLSVTMVQWLNLVYRSMSRTSWAYPKDAELYYAYDSTGATSARLVADAGYTLGSDGASPKGWQET